MTTKVVIEVEVTTEEEDGTFGIKSVLVDGVKVPTLFDDYEIWAPIIINSSDNRSINLSLMNPLENDDDQQI
jgi:hypothetical protein